MTTHHYRTRPRFALVDVVLVIAIALAIGVMAVALIRISDFSHSAPTKDAAGCDRQHINH